MGKYCQYHRDPKHGTIDKKGRLLLQVSSKGHWDRSLVPSEAKHFQYSHQNSNPNKAIKWAGGAVGKELCACLMFTRAAGSAGQLVWQARQTCLSIIVIPLVFVKVCGEFTPLCEVYYVINTRLYLFSHETVAVFVYIINFIAHYVLDTRITVYYDICPSCLWERCI